MKQYETYNNFIIGKGLNIEDVYAFELSPEDKLKAHWKYYLDNNLWISQDGTPTLISDLPNGHLRDILQMLVRFNSETSRPMLIRLIDEAHKRKLDIKIGLKEI